MEERMQEERMMAERQRVREDRPLASEDRFDAAADICTDFSEY